MTSEEPVEGRCNAQCRDGNYCTQWPVTGQNRCKMHGGLGSGPPENNKNAMTHGLRADPVGLFEWLQENEPAAAQWIIAKLVDYSYDAPKEIFVADYDPDDELELEDRPGDEDRPGGELQMNLTAYGDDVLQMCVRDYTRWKAAKIQAEEGVIKEQYQRTQDGDLVEVQDSNPVNLDLDRMDRTISRIKKDFGLSPSEGGDSDDLNNMVVEINRSVVGDDDSDDE